MRRLVIISSCVLVLVGLVAWDNITSHRAPSRGGLSPGQALLVGNRGVASASDSAPAGRAEAFPFVAVRGGTAAAIHLLVSRVNAARTIQIAIYADANGQPARRLTLGTLRHPRGDQWGVATVRRLALRGGATYWLAVLGNGGRAGYRDDNATTCESQVAAQTGLPSPPPTWRSSQHWSTCFLSAYVTGTPGLAPSPSPTQSDRPALNDCFSAPRSCGYPDPQSGNVGPASSCSTLTPSGPVTTSLPGETIQNLNVSGTLTVNTPNVTVRNVCVTANGTSQFGSVALQILSGASHTVVENSTIRGYGSGASDSVDMGVKNWSGQPATLNQDYIYNCGECIHDGPWTVNDSYVISNGMQNTAEHYEAVYYDNNVPPPGMSFNHDVILNPQDQSGVIFSDDTTSNQTCAVNLTVKNSLIAGGGGMISFCGKTTSVGKATMDIEGNHFARCTTRPITKAPDGGTDCSGSTGTGIAAGSDSHGYWPLGGHYATNGMNYCRAPQSTWSRGNVWDDDGTFLPCS